VAHRRAKLTVFGRQLLVQRITELGWPVAGAAESLGVRRATAPTGSAPPLAIPARPSMGCCAAMA
jgi:hypothetical protein